MQPSTVYAAKPWESNEERLTDQALRTAETPAELIRQIRPPVPQMLFRPPYGYPVYAQRQIQITQIGLLPALYPQVDYSGRISGYQGSSRSGFPALNTF